jgi:hypothetical protein
MGHATYHELFIVVHTTRGYAHTVMCAFTCRWAHSLQIAENILHIRLTKDYIDYVHVYIRFSDVGFSPTDLGTHYMSPRVTWATYCSCSGTALAC